MWLKLSKKSEISPLQCGQISNSILYSQILNKGEVQVGEKERDHDLTSLRKEIATLVAEKCVDPSNHPYPVGMIEKAMAEAGFSVKQNKNAKSQVKLSPWISVICIKRSAFV